MAPGLTAAVATPAATKVEDLVVRNEAELIREAQRGSADAARQLVDLHWGGAYRSAYFIVQDREAAEDIAQEAIVSALDNLSGFRPHRRFGPWIHRIAVNRAIDSVRMRQRRAEVPLDDTVTRGHGSSKSVPGPLLSGLADLAAEDRAIVVLRHVFDYRANEIGRMLDLPSSTVRTRLQRALRRLHELLNEEDL